MTDKHQNADKLIQKAETIGVKTSEVARYVRTPHNGTCVQKKTVKMQLRSKSCP